MHTPLAYLPSPSRGVWHLGPLPIRAYALCIILGIIVAVAVTDRRWRNRGGSPGTVGTLVTWAIPFGLVGARLYHVVTDPELYFKPGRDWVRVFYIWDGGLGIWGSIALGALGVWIACRRYGIAFPAFADAAAPGIAFAQAIGRWGNYFNQELYGKPTTMPWGLRIDGAHTASGLPGIYQPTFLYESLWDAGTAVFVLWADRRFRLGHGRAFLLYAATYTVGRGWIEYLRVDHANHILGLRLNDWTSIFVFLGSVIAFVVSARRSPGREVVVEGLRSGSTPPGAAVADSSGVPGGHAPGAVSDSAGEASSAVAVDVGPPGSAPPAGADGSEVER
ncbi:MAG: prolipoprotein diacylglyceryl transferase [Acidothermus cellulolyticus]|nr:prolipoprotein diacylglyceryl transferase [Acidothermus cellulolyticus]MCL6549480.1 prolipoprotein diacylglyceryl transferase [Acidothermus cellulolyticus]